MSHGYLHTMLDMLTGAYNRRFFERFIENAIGRAKRERRSVTVLVFDIDDFKFFNDCKSVFSDQYLAVNSNATSRMPVANPALGVTIPFVPSRRPVSSVYIVPAIACFRRYGRPAGDAETSPTRTVSMTYKKAENTVVFPF